MLETNHKRLICYTQTIKDQYVGYKPEKINMCRYKP